MFPVSLQFLGISLSQLPYFLLAFFAVVVAYIIYKFRLAPTIEYPLANEEDLGIGKVSLPQLGRLNEGRLTTARRYVQGLWAKLITSAEKDAQAGLIGLRDLMLSGFLIAQRVGREKIIYIFDADPMDPKYHVREDHGHGNTAVRWIGPVQDSMSLGSFDGFEFIHGKLKTEQFHFSEDERSKWSTVLSALSFLRLAAENKGELKTVKDRNVSLEALLEDERKSHAKTRSKLDRSNSALEQKTLSTTGEAKISGAFSQKIKEWFSLYQLLSAGAFYFIVSPLLMSMFFNTATPPTTTYITAGITIAGFFSIPVFRKVFGRWL